MADKYNHKEVESRISEMWRKGNYFTPKINPSKKPFSMFLVPPNASGGMHVGNIFMVAIQDILARYYRSKGRPTLWIPSTDHGGYETQVTFERKLEAESKSRFDYHSSQLFLEIEKYVADNTALIKSEIDATGASVDWSRFRYTMDEKSLAAVDQMFRKMLADNLIYRNKYMVNYCSACGTALADIELKTEKITSPLYFIKFPDETGADFLSLATTRPEFIFATTHVLVHPSDKTHAKHIGKILKNPITGERVEIVASKRKFDPKVAEPYLTPFAPSYKNYDYGYTLYNDIPSKSLLDWNGNMIERYPGIKPFEAREKEIDYLNQNGLIEKIDELYVDSVLKCKRGHLAESMMMQTWFLKLDDNKKSLKKPAVDALRKGSISILPKWHTESLAVWLEKMHDWPIARQTVWGIRIPIWYEVTDASQFIVWFVDKSGYRQNGNLKSFLDNGVPFDEIELGMERIYAFEGVRWVNEREEGKIYLQETDTFDTWLSSGNWATAVYGDIGSADFSYFYPSEIMVIGNDLIRLSVARKIFLSYYMTGRLPFKTVYLHKLIKGKDGQKMSKSLGNATSLEYYLDTYGADVTRMSLISYLTTQEDFILEDERLIAMQKFSDQIWQQSEVIKLANQYAPQFTSSLPLLPRDIELIKNFEILTNSLGTYLNRYQFAQAQQSMCDFLNDLEKYIKTMDTKVNTTTTLSVFRHVFNMYVVALHPFMPFMTEELQAKLFDANKPLAATKNDKK